MKKTVTAVCALAAILVAGFARNAMAEDISADVLKQMGLGGMQQLSDEQGMQVRGHGMAAVYGLGFASTIMATKINSFQGSSFVDNALAHGNNLAEARTSISLNLGLTTLSLSLYSGAGGSAYAFGK